MTEKITTHVVEEGDNEIKRVSVNDRTLYLQANLD